MNTIHIALASDENYAPFLGVTMTSILANARNEDELAFHILDGGLSEESRAKIATLREIHPFTVEYIRPELAEFVRNVHMKRTPNHLARLFLPELLAPDVGRCIYLDADLLVLDSLRELWETDLCGKALAGAPDVVVVLKMWSLYPRRIGGQGMYFNSGVLLLDVDKLRANGMFETTKQVFLERYQAFKLTDQDALNLCFDTQLHVLDASWNAQQNRSFDAYRRHFLRKEYARAWNQPKIIHFIGKVKPWHVMYLSSGKALFLQYLARSPWHDLPLPEPTDQERRRIRLRTHPAYRAAKWCLLWLRLAARKLEHLTYRVVRTGKKGKKEEKS